MDVSIGVGAAGLLVYKGQLRAHRFPWAKIIKIAYKRNKFTVRLRAGEVCLAVSVALCLFVSLVSLSVCLSVCMSLCPSVHLSVFIEFRKF